jgi:hypothetical protein
MRRNGAIGEFSQVGRIPRRVCGRVGAHYSWNEAQEKTTRQHKRQPAKALTSICQDAAVPCKTARISGLPYAIAIRDQKKKFGHENGWHTPNSLARKK